MKQSINTFLKTVLLMLFFGLGTKPIAQNKEIEVKAELKSVTLYNAAADVFCASDLQLKKGRTTIVFTELTPFIEQNSIELSLSNSSVEIISVTEKINYVKERIDNNKKVTNIQDTLNRLKKEIGLLSVKKEAYSLEKKLLFKDESIGGVSKGVNVSEIEKASAFFSKRYIELSMELFEIEKKEAELNDIIRRNEMQLNQQAIPSKSISEIIVVVQCEVDTKTTIQFKYLTSKAGWAPLYDCKFGGTQQELKFIFRANVFNASGTDWNNVELTLSTATPLRAFTSPTQAMGQSNNVSGKVTGVNYKDVQVSNAITSYVIKNTNTIPSDSKPYLVDVNQYDFPAQFHYLVLPGIDPYGFLMSKIPNWNQHNLMPGTMNVYNRGSYMGKTFLQTYTDNDTISIFLGKDNNIQTQRKETNNIDKNLIVGNYYFDKSDISISLKNTSKDNVKIEMWDLVPIIGDDEKLKLNIQDVLQAVHDKKQGLLIWNFELASSESKTIDYKYEIKIPKPDFGSYKPRKKSYRTISCPSF
jgi:hypothetical protein